jgi:hypothetical protein
LKPKPRKFVSCKKSQKIGGGDAGSGAGVGAGRGGQNFPSRRSWDPAFLVNFCKSYWVLNDVCVLALWGWQMPSGPELPAREHACVRVPACACVCVGMGVCACVCLRARACVRACVCACVCWVVRENGIPIVGYVQIYITGWQPRGALLPPLPCPVLLPRKFVPRMQ